MRRATYCVEYRMHGNGVKRIPVVANNKEDAWDIATYEIIPEIEGEMAYSTWVASVTYSNGNCHTFNTFEGKPY